MKSSVVPRLIKQLVRGLFFKGVFPATPLEVEHAEWAFYIKYLRKDMVAFDVGAHVGEVTLLFSKFVGEQGQVHGFEASSAAFERLKAICELAGRKNIILNHIALSDKEGMVRLHVYDDEHLSWSSLVQRPLDRYGIDVKPVSTEKVLATTVDVYCEKNGIPQIDLLKIDVEGLEYQVLLGARRMLESKKIRCCVFEFGATTFDMGNNPDEFEAYLKQFGYRVWNAVKDNPVFPGRTSAEMACFSMYVAVPKA